MNNLEVLTTKPNVIKWTRQNRHKKEERSVIDYVITNQRLAAHVNEAIIDEEGIYRIKGKKENIHALN